MNMTNTSDFPESVRQQYVDRCQQVSDCLAANTLRLAEEIKEHFNADIAMVNLVSRERVEIKASSGISALTAYTKRYSPCSLTVFRNEVTVISDFSDYGYLNRSAFHQVIPKVGFYAAAPIRVDGAAPVGTIVIVSEKPIHFDDQDAAVLSRYAAEIAADFDVEIRTLEQTLHQQQTLENIDRLKSEVADLRQEHKGLTNWSVQMRRESLERAVSGSDFDELELQHAALDRLNPDKITHINFDPSSLSRFEDDLSDAA